MLRAAYIGVAIALALALTAPLAPGALAAPPRARVVLADPDPELLRAVKSALAPWRLEVIVDEAPPIDEADAATRAVAMSVRFIVWRRKSALVVYDHERGSTEERASPDGPLDAVDAAAAALTVKTLMRLPPPPPPDDPEPPIAPPRDEPGLEVRAQAALAARLARGDTTEGSARLVAALLLRPLPRLPWRLGVAGDLGSRSTVEKASFKGNWTDWTVLAITSWAIQAGAWELEPELGVGVTRSSLDGTQMSDPRHERATLGSIHGGVAVRRRLGRWTFGGVAGVDGHLGTPTYTRVGSSARIFEVPSLAAALGIMVAADFGGAH